MSDQQSQVPAPIQADPPEKRANGKGIGCLLGAVIAVGLLFYACSGTNRTSTRAPEPTITLPDGRQIDKYDAQAMCTIKIKEQLVAPATAKFQSPSTSRTGNQWRVSYNVDSQNAFGALLRSVWLCVIDGTADTISAIQQR